METNDTISTANLHLLVKIFRGGIYFATYNPLEDDTYQGVSIVAEARDTFSLETIKDLVYENPLLLQEYARTYVLVDTTRFTFVPENIEPQESERPAYYDYCFPGHTDYVVENRLQINRTYSLFGIDHELYAFLCRTFSNPLILHPLTSLCEYFAQHSRNGNEAKVYLHLREKRLDVVVFKQGRLLLANTFAVSTPEDAAYFTLQIYKQLSLDQVRDRIYMVGDKALRQSLTPMLQEYVQSVLPYPFPSQLFRIGKDTIDAPFELITIPLCAL
ncbi:MAG: DUF3822 family protein [Coprobacter sp.]|nr:DUF3822 family protein [Coprobacter sp.]